MREKLALTALISAIFIRILMWIRIYFFLLDECLLFIILCLFRLFLLFEILSHFQCPFMAFLLHLFPQVLIYLFKSLLEMVKHEFKLCEVFLQFLFVSQTLFFRLFLLWIIFWIQLLFIQLFNFFFINIRKWYVLNWLVKFSQYLGNCRV